jgi:hypothetical protein
MTAIRPNRVKQKLAEGGRVLSIAGADSPDLIDQIGPTAPDAIWLEAEHGPRERERERERESCLWLAKTTLMVRNKYRP